MYSRRHFYFEGDPCRARKWHRRKLCRCSREINPLIINLTQKGTVADGIIASFAKLRILASGKNERNGNEDEEDGGGVGGGIGGGGGGQVR